MEKKAKIQKQNNKFGTWVRHQINWNGLERRCETAWYTGGSNCCWLSSAGSTSLGFVTGGCCLWRWVSRRFRICPSADEQSRAMIADATIRRTNVCALVIICPCCFDVFLLLLFFLVKKWNLKWTEKEEKWETRDGGQKRIINSPLGWRLKPICECFPSVHFLWAFSQQQQRKKRWGSGTNILWKKCLLILTFTKIRDRIFEMRCFCSCYFRSYLHFKMIPKGSTMELHPLSNATQKQAFELEYLRAVHKKQLKLC